jgi:hypothetical protein
MPDRIHCAAFDDGVGELALELLDPRDRDALILHAAGCSRCRAELESFAGIADLLLTLAPSAEPPVGFEQRALDAMGDAHRQAGLRLRIGPFLAAAAAIIVVGLAGVLLGRSTTSPDPRVAALDRVGIGTVRSARLVGSDGIDHGSVLLSAGPDAMLTMRLERLDRGTYHCVLHATDGSTTEVAAWPIGASGGGTWAVTIGRPQATIDRVLVTEDSGSTLAIAVLR